MIPTECYSQSMSLYVYDRRSDMTGCMNKKVFNKIIYVPTLFRNNSKNPKNREWDWDTTGAVP